jgi:hypothetical protein
LRRPDLAITFESSDGNHADDPILWIEIKHGTGPSRGQLQAYIHEQVERQLRHAAVLLVAPRAGYEEFRTTEIPQSVFQVTWEDTAEVLKAYRPKGPVGSFLADELLQYLREEGLVDPDELKAEHLVALENYREGLQALLRIGQIAAAEVNRLWNQGAKGERYPTRGTPKEYYWHHELSARDGTRIGLTSFGLSWRVLLDGSYTLPEAQPGVPVFMAGLVGERGAIGTLSDPVRGALELAGFQLMPIGTSNSRNYEYIVRTRSLGVLHDGDLKSNGSELASWVNETFRDLAARVDHCV